VRIPGIAFDGFDLAPLERAESGLLNNSAPAFSAIG
jgi:hypothetical protein